MKREAFSSALKSLDAASEIQTVAQALGKRGGGRKTSKEHPWRKADRLFHLKYQEKRGKK